MNVRGLLFDFDGLLVETEGPAFESWRWIYQEYGHDLPLERWVSVVGTIYGSSHTFHPVAHLEELTGRTLDRASIIARRKRRKAELVAAEPLRPGVESYLNSSAALGLKTAIVTSDTTAWINSHLERLAVRHHWHCINCADGSIARSKPAPDLYLEALDSLGISPGEAIAFEDSPNGIKAAKAAGLCCVAVPNRITQGLDLSEADLQLRSLEDMPLEQLIAMVQARSA